VSTRARIAVFASGGGTNLQALIDRFNVTGSRLARVELVVGNRSGIGALERAEAAGIPAHVATGVSGEADALLGVLEGHGIGLVVLAGYLKLVPPRVVERFRDGMINIHPALLPAFGGKGMYGLHVHRAVLASGTRVTGATVHLVEENFDEGRILAQWPVPVLPTDNPERLAARVLKVEHMILPLAVEVLLSGGNGEGGEGDLSFDLVEAAAPGGEAVRRLHPRRPLDGRQPW